MNRSILLLLPLLWLSSIGAQTNISALEYFYDADPGVGNATALSVTPAASVSLSQNLPTTGLAAGFHRLFVRAKFATGQWGTTSDRTFYLFTPTATGNQNIAALEYFYDTDPGVGNGTPISVTPGTAVSAALPLPTTGLAAGFHRLFVRAKFASGLWGTTADLTFYLFTPTVTAAQNISTLEYFYDTDPGVGNGTALSVTPGTAVSAAVALPSTGLAAGFHRLFVRAKFAGGQWGTTADQTFYLFTPTVSANQNIVAAEAFFDTDPGVGNGTAVAVPTGASISTQFNITVPALSIGTHYLYVRVKFANGQWGMAERQTFQMTNVVYNVTLSNLNHAGNGCGVTSNSTITATLTNNTNVSLPASYANTTLAVSGANSGTYSVVNAAAIPANSSVIVTFSGVNLSNYGLNNLSATASVPNDPNLADNTTTLALTGVQGYNFYADTDGDGFGDPAVSQLSCTQPANYVSNNTDCNDSNVNVHPGQTEICNGLDDNCVGGIDEGVQTTFYRDLDADGFGNPAVTQLSCSQPTGYVLNNTDCNDANANVRPTATEICNSLDDDCDNLTDDADPSISGQPTWYADADSDGHGNPAVSQLSCTQPTGYVASNDDCAPATAAIFPGQTEICNSLDDDCDGLTDDADPGVSGRPTWYADTDNDSHGNPAVSQLSCTQPTGYVSSNDDCAPADGARFPGATEICNTLDDDCDGQIDENVQSTFYADTDGDGHGNPAATNLACTAPNGFVSNNDDCNDNPATGGANQFPGNTEVCDGLDNDCDGSVDEGVLPINYYADADADGHGNPAVSQLSCTQPTGYVLSNDDCNDNCAACFPGHAETCDALDNDCDNLTDDADSDVSGRPTWYADSDSDTHGDPAVSQLSCLQPANYVSSNDDCDDANTAVHPGATEVCNELDDNCVGGIDEGVQSEFYLDSDNDGYGAGASVLACTAPANYAAQNGDCAPANPAIHPNAAETCNNLDDDCDSDVDEGFSHPVVTVTPSESSICTTIPATAANLTANVTGGTGSLGFAWSPGSATTPSISPTPSVSTTYNVTVTDEDGCTGTASGHVTVRPPVAAGISPPISVCAGRDTVLTATGGETYLWNTGETTASIPVNLASGSQNFSCTVSDSGGCTDVVSSSVTVVGSAPTLAFAGEQAGWDYANTLVLNHVGSPYDKFYFKINYTDADGQLPAPGWPRLFMDFENNGTWTNENDRALVMQKADPADNDPTDGITYYVDALGLNPTDNWFSKVYAYDATGCVSAAMTENAPDVRDQLDIYAFANDIAFSKKNPDPGETVKVWVKMHNDSDEDATGFSVRLKNQYSNETWLQTGLALASHSELVLEFQIVMPNAASWDPLEVDLDFGENLAEFNELNNYAVRPITVGPYQLPGTIAVAAAVNPNPAVIVHLDEPVPCVLSGRATYDIIGLTLDDPSVAGAEGTITVTETGWVFHFTTDSHGNFAVGFNAPTVPGLYHFTGEITDFSLDGTFDGSFEVQLGEAPERDFSVAMGLTPHDPYISYYYDYDGGIWKLTTLEGSTATASFTVHYSGSLPATQYTVLTVHSPNAVPEYLSFTVPPMNPGDSWTPSPVLFTFPHYGTSTISAYADAANQYWEGEEGEKNNGDYALVRVLKALPDLVPRPSFGERPNSGISVAECKQPFSKSFKISNIGGADAGAFTAEMTLTHAVSGNVYTFTQAVSGLARLSEASLVFPNLNLPELGNYALVLKLDVPYSSLGNVLEWKENNNTFVSMGNVHICQPDLAVGDFSQNIDPIDPQNPGFLDVVAPVSNIGELGVSVPVVVRFRVIEPGGATTDVTQTLASGLTEDALQNVAAQVAVPPPGDNRLEVRVDPANAILESNEENNFLTVKLCHDFNVGRVSGGQMLLNQPFTAQAQVGNGGAYKASVLSVHFEISGPGIVGWHDLGTAEVNGIGAFSGSLVNAPSVYAPASVGNFTVRVTVDSDNDYIECDETNNVGTGVFAAIDQPDYFVASYHIEPNPLNPEPGQPMTVNVSFKNLGMLNVGSTFAVNLKVDNTVVATATANGLNTNDLGTVQFTNIGAGLPVGLHILRAILDANHEIAEANEGNNEATRAILVGQFPNLFIQILTADNAAPPLGSDITLTTKIVNEGDLACQAFVRYTASNSLVPFAEVPVTVPANSFIEFSSVRWPVSDPNATIKAEIFGGNPPEYNLTDNVKLLALNSIALDYQTLASTCPAPFGDDGFAKVLASGGQAPYDFEWSAGGPTGSIGQSHDLAPGVYTVSVSDAAGHESSISFEVPFISDGTAPSISGQSNRTVYAFDGVCPQVVEYPSDWLPTLSDFCDPAPSLAANPPSGTAFAPGNHTITFTATDFFGNTRTAQVTLTVFGTPTTFAGSDQFVCTTNTVLAAAPIPGTFPVAEGTWTLENGSANLAPADANDPDAPLGDLGTSPVTMRWTIINGSCPSTYDEVSVSRDVTPPTAICRTFDINLPASGSLLLTGEDLGNDSEDDSPCYVDHFAPAEFFFNCNNLGINDIALTVFDGAGNTASCMAHVTVLDPLGNCGDNVPPTALCQDVTVNLDENGTGNIPAASLNNGSSDNVTAPGNLNFSVSPTEVNCLDLGSPVTAILTVADASGNTANCTASVSFSDDYAPTAVCAPNLSVSLNAAGQGFLPPNAAAGASTDNCSVPLGQSPAVNVDCANVGENPSVVLTVSDASGNTASTSCSFAVLDVLPPVPVCQNVTISLGADGTGTLAASAVNNFSNDNCTAFENLTLNIQPLSVTCADIGASFTRLLTVGDDYGNTSTCSATVSVSDNYAPTAVCQDAVISLGALGTGTLTAEDLNGVSFDNCTAAGNLTFSIPATNKTCSDVGTSFTQILTVGDASGNTSTCSATVSFSDDYAPTAVCQNATIFLGAVGTGTLTAAELDGGSSDNCTAAADLTLSIPATSRACIHVGTSFTQILTVADASGNTASCSAIVSVSDSYAPTAICHNATISIGASGMGTLAASALNNGSFDNCTAAGNLTLSIPATNRNCADVGTSFTQILTVADASGNTATCSATVSVSDNYAPTAVCKTGISLWLSSNGEAQLLPADVNNGSTDNCTASGSLTMTVLPAEFHCTDIGTQTVTLQVRDASNNLGSCSVTVQVLDLLQFSEIGRRNGSDEKANDQFGTSVAIGGGVAVAGSPQAKVGNNNKQGAAYVFGGANWVQTQKLAAPDGQASDYFGQAVATDGTSFLVGAHAANVPVSGGNNDQGAVYAFPGGQKLVAPDGQAYDYFGNALALLGNTAAIGAYRAKIGTAASQGAAYIFEKSGATWAFSKKLTVPTADAGTNIFFGTSVAQATNLAISGATGKANNLGAAYIFGRNTGGAGNWGLVKKLTPSDGVSGDVFGTSTALSTDYALVGASGKGSYKGAAYVFKRSLGGADNWGQAKKLTASNPANNDYFGASVALAGDYALVGAPRWNNVGAVFVFYRNMGGTDNWGELGHYLASDAENAMEFGNALATSNNDLAVGAWKDNILNPTRGNAGSLYLFHGHFCENGRPEETVAAANSAVERNGVSPELRCLPNPFGGELSIETELESPGELTVTDAVGRVVLALPMSAGRGVFVWNAEGFAPGIYFVQLRTGAGARVVSVVKI